MNILFSYIIEINLTSSRVLTGMLLSFISDLTPSRSFFPAASPSNLPSSGVPPALEMGICGPTGACPLGLHVRSLSLLAAGLMEAALRREVTSPPVGEVGE